MRQWRCFGFKLVGMVKMTDEEIAAIELEPCSVCDSENTSVRRARANEYFVGCYDCSNKIECDEKYLPEAIETWNRRSKKWRALRRR